MSKSYKAASSVGTVALVLSGSVMAAAPSFDNWSVTNGTISSGACQAGYSCGSAMSDVGFFQRMVTETGTGQVFFQTIITENNANGSGATLANLVFSDESFVRTGNVNGIADKQRVAQIATGVAPDTTSFRSSTTLGSGWAGDSLTLTQSLEDSVDGFQTDFIFSQQGVSTNPTAKGMKITAYVPIQGTDKQDFVLVSLQGDYADVTSNVSGGKSTVTLPGSTGGTMSWTNDTTPGVVGLTGSTEGDRIQAVWVGQDLSTIVGQKFGFTSYDNLTTAAADFISTFSLTDTAAVNWAVPVWGDLVTQGTVTNPF